MSTGNQTQDQIRTAGPNDALDTDWVAEFGNGPFRPVDMTAPTPTPTLIDRDSLADEPVSDFFHLTLDVRAVPFAFEMPDPAGPGRLYIAGSIDYAGQLLNAMAYSLDDDTRGMRPVADWWAEL